MKRRSAAFSAIVAALAAVAFMACSTPTTDKPKADANPASADKTELAQAITVANALYDATEAGTAAGQAPQPAKDSFGAAIDAAETVNADAAATQAEVDGALAALGLSILAFQSAIIAEPDDTLTIGAGGVDTSAGGIYSETYAIIAADMTWDHAENGDNGSLPLAITNEDSDSADGATCAKIDYSATTVWGGMFFKPEAPAAGNTAAYKDGALVFSLKGDVADMEIKIESAGQGASVFLKNFTPETADGWKTYAIPMASFKAKNASVDLENLTVFAGFWHPKKADGTTLYDSYYLLDNVYYAANYAAPVESLTASPASVILMAGASKPVAITSDPGALAVDAAEVSWASGDEGADGVITGVADGTTVITASYGGKSVGIAVEVTSTLPPLGLDFTDLSLDELPVVNCAVWGGGNTDPSLAENVYGAANAIRYTLASTMPWYGCFWQRDGGGSVDVSGYENLVITFNDSDLDAAVNTAVVKMNSVGGTEKALQIAAGDFPGTVSAADANGWKTITVPLSAFTGVDMTKVYVVAFADQLNNPYLPETAPAKLNGSLYVSAVSFE